MGWEWDGNGVVVVGWVVVVMMLMDPRVVGCLVLFVVFVVLMGRVDGALVCSCVVVVVVFVFQSQSHVVSRHRVVVGLGVLVVVVVLVLLPVVVVQ